MAKGVEEAVDKIATDYFTQVRDESVKILAEQDKIVTGGIADSIQFKIGEGKRELFSDHDGFYAVENGRMKGSKPPPKKVLAEWMIAKYGMGRKEAWSRTKAVQDKIYKNGIKPSNAVRIAKHKVLGVVG